MYRPCHQRLRVQGVLFLLFQLGNEHFGISCDKILQVIPDCRLIALINQPDYVSGYFQDSEKLIPVIDLSHFILGHPCTKRLNTRIIMVRNDFGEKTCLAAGLMAEKVVETVHKSNVQTTVNPIDFSFGAIINSVLIYNERSIQLIDVNRLLRAAFSEKSRSGFPQDHTRDINELSN